MRDFSEKRGFIRMSMQCPVSIRSRDDDAETAQLQDLSASGVRFLSHRARDRGTRLQLSLTPLRPITPPLQAEVAVIRCDETADGFDIAASIELLAPAVYPDEA